MKILFTGVSSFTGYWFVKSLAAAGHEVVCPLRAAPETYQGVRRRRMDAVQSLCRLVPLMPFGSEPFMELIAKNGPWSLLCHHAAYAAEYRSPDFDTHRAFHENTLQLRPILQSLKSGGLKAVLLTGSVFENDEGAGDEPLRAFSPYGLSKALTWQAFRFYCGQAQLPLGKFVIPNPFGPMEEPRFTAYLMNTWKDGRPAAVKTPDYLRDNIHVDLLTSVYTQFAMRLATGSPAVLPLKINPSGYVETQGHFATRVAREVRTRLGWACTLELARQEDFTEPLRRINTDPAAPLCPDWNESASWDAFAHFYA